MGLQAVGLKSTLKARYTLFAQRDLGHWHITSLVNDYQPGVSALRGA